MNIKKIREKKKQVTTLKSLLILGLGLALLVTTIVMMINHKDDKKKEAAHKFPYNDLQSLQAQNLFSSATL